MCTVNDFLIIFINLLKLCSLRQTYEVKATADLYYSQIDEIPISHLTQLKKIVGDDVPLKFKIKIDPSPSLAKGIV